MDSITTTSFSSLQMAASTSNTFMAIHPSDLFALFVIGIIVSCVNSISGGGSILSLPLLIFLGLPSAVANGTNRLGVLLGSLGSWLGFKSHGLILPKQTWQVGWPAALGASLGSFLAIKLPDHIFNPILACIILFVVFMTLRGHGVKTTLLGMPELQTGLWPFLAYLGIGFYGGFIQAGSGLIMIFTFSRLSNLDIFRINALKVSNTLIFITVSLVIFGIAGKINWPMAMAFGFGNFIGGLIGSHWQIKQGARWINRFLFYSGIAMAMKLIWDSVQVWNRL